ncbi:cytochrome C [Mangrovicoccus sp. HB182678]|uniref:Cytochrome C n=1 Tax=Mangrovicoccus algicola TaxID=2771008 RepID=A0A8J6YZM9_9RHOB|nr:cytochrome C [Mangrovicoccus algicola]
MLLAAGQPALAGGDAAAGEDGFRRCQACHVVRAPSGEVLAGRSARTGPDLYGLPGRVLGSQEDFAYSQAFEEARAAGLTWDEDAFAAYLQDPGAYLSQVMGHRLRSKMTFRLRDEAAARDLWAYLESLSAPE